MSRQRTVQAPPDQPVQQFPVRVTDNVVYRAARQEPWWFCRCGECRFDLVGSATEVLGTLYAGTEPITGLLEVIGPELIGRVVARRFLSERTVWMLCYNRPLDLADVVDRRAIGFGVTNELCTMVPYAVPQAWAEAFAEAGFDGIAYRTRFDTGPETTGVAWFDDAGSHPDWPADPYWPADGPEALAALAMVGIAVEDPPPLAALEVR